MSTASIPAWTGPSGGRMAPRPWPGWTGRSRTSHVPKDAERLVIDAPAALKMKDVEALLKIADVIILPVLPSAFDEGGDPALPDPAGGAEADPQEPRRGGDRRQPDAGAHPGGGPAGRLPGRAGPHAWCRASATAPPIPTPRPTASACSTCAAAAPRTCAPTGRRCCDISSRRARPNSLSRGGGPACPFYPPLPLRDYGIHTSSDQ